MKDPKIGLALGSGAARGLSHVGVIRALKENNIPISVIAGTSIGAVVGLLCSADLSIEKMTQFAREFGEKRIPYWFDPAIFRSGGLLKGDRIEQSLTDLVGPVDFSDLKTPLYVISTDLTLGKEVVLKEGSVIKAVRASFAIPGIFSPVKIDGRWLVDGALTEPIPVRILKKECDIVIGVNVCSEPESSEAIESGGSPKMLDVIIQALAVIQQKLAEHCMGHADVRIVPKVGRFSWTDFSKAGELMEIGYNTALSFIPEIKSLMASKRRKNFLARLFK